LGQIPIRAPILSLNLVFNQTCLLALDFDNPETRLLPLLRMRLGAHVTVALAPLPPYLVDAVAAYFDGEIHAFDRVSLDPGGSAFQRQVWQGLGKIPPGSTTSYQDLASALGRPGAARAVGHANARNPINIAIPCHRLVGSNQSLTGYSGGLARKRWLLAHEARYAQR
jgi:methylated-DNA-[protein]-cysteine S-methyltransferase